MSEVPLAQRNVFSTEKAGKYEGHFVDLFKSHFLLYQNGEGEGEEESSTCFLWLLINYS